MSGSSVGEAGAWACEAACADSLWVRNMSGMFLLSCVPGSNVIRDDEELRVDLLMLNSGCGLPFKLRSVPGSQELLAYAAISVSVQATPQILLF